LRCATTFAGYCTSSTSEAWRTQRLVNGVLRFSNPADLSRRLAGNGSSNGAAIHAVYPPSLRAKAWRATPAFCMSTIYFPGFSVFRLKPGSPLQPSFGRLCGLWVRNIQDSKYLLRPAPCIFSHGLWAESWLGRLPSHMISNFPTNSRLNDHRRSAKTFNARREREMDQFP
jgi:hypothetical protein